jgi:uncharacterized oligopeptide transporter (OPT) family protein
MPDLPGLSLFFVQFHPDNLCPAVFEYKDIGNVWRTLIPAFLLVILGVLFFISLRRSKEILW